MDFIVLKTSGTRHIVGNLITATYITIAVARILVVSIRFSPASDCKEKNILLYEINIGKLPCFRSIVIIIIIIITAIIIKIAISSIIAVTKQTDVF